MTQTQRIIKYFAIAFAAVIIVSLFTWLTVFMNLFSGKGGDVIGEFTNTEYSGEITKLKIDVKAVEFEITEGETFCVGTNNRKISHSLSGKTLTIKESGRGITVGDAGKLVLTIPAGYELEVVEIDAGAGVMDIESLSAERIDFELGAGKVIINKLTVKNSADIDSGTGTVEITEADIANLDFDLGVGKVELKGKISGKSDMDFGVGEAVIGLEGSLDDYSITVNKGIGSVTIDGKAISDGNRYGEGDSVIKMDGGVGNIEVYFYD